MLDHPASKIAVAVAGLPVLILLCLSLVFFVVDMSRRRLGQSGVSYRPIRARIADWMLILRLWRKK